MMLSKSSATKLSKLTRSCLITFIELNLSQVFMNTKKSIS